MSCIGECKKLIGGSTCRCKEIWTTQLELFKEHFKRERLHGKGMCDCHGICLYPNPYEYTTQEQRDKMIDAYSEQEYYNYVARYKERIDDMKRKASLLVKTFAGYA